MSTSPHPPLETPAHAPKDVTLVEIPLPASDQRVKRDAVFAQTGERRSRYTLPEGLVSASPVGYRSRLSMSADELQACLPLLSLTRPTAFVEHPEPVSEQALFEESALGILSSRQSTNFRGHRQVTLGPDDSASLASLMRQLPQRSAPVLDHAGYTHVVLSQPYRTPFTLLLTFIGHPTWTKLPSIIRRAVRKRFLFEDDIPTIGFLQHLHVGILADAMERATVIASAGRRRANIHMAPFCGDAQRANREVLRKMHKLVGLTPAMHRKGWRIALVAQVGDALDHERVALDEATARKLGANLLAFRSERIQPGVNQDDSAPPQYSQRQDVDVPDALTEMAGRALYNAFAHWTGCNRDDAKNLVLLERIDVMKDEGKERLRRLRTMLGHVADLVQGNLPTWIDIPSGKQLSRGVDRGRKAFALAGQRIYIGGLSRADIARANLDWDLCVCAIGAAAARSALVAELMGVLDIPDDCDMRAGICLMAGPVNQNDIGKQFWGLPDMLVDTYPDRDPTSLLVWTLKAKTIADPIGNEEQLLNPKRKGALVDLRPGPHEVITLVRRGQHLPMRKRGGQVSHERAFADQGNFVTDPNGAEIPGNRGVVWDPERRETALW